MQHLKLLTLYYVLTNLTKHFTFISLANAQLLFKIVSNIFNDPLCDFCILFKNTSLKIMLSMRS